MSEKEEMAERIAQEMNRHMVRRIEGLPVTGRMRRWGITSMVIYRAPDQPVVTDAEGQQEIPAAVAVWLMGGE